MNKKLLLVEDEKHLAVGLQLNFEMQGYEVTLAPDGVSALSAWRRIKPHIIILDLMLPGLNGFEVLSEIRKSDATTPVIVLSAKNEDECRVKCLAGGSDDFLAKPFVLDELILRVERLLKWSESSVKPTHSSEFLKLGALRVDLSKGSVEGGGKEFELTEQELKLLQVFVSNEEQFLSRKQLLTYAWGYPNGMETRTVDNFIVRLRKYFEPDPKNPIYFLNKRNRGYLFRNTPSI